jgi:hypothetical protein
MSEVWKSDVGCLLPEIIRQYLALNLSASDFGPPASD